MASNVTRAAAAFAAALVSLLIGFAVMSVHDTQSLATVRSALVITQVDEAAPVLQLLQTEARQRHANFFRIRTDPTGSTSTRTLAPIIGDPAAYDRAFPSGEYARFDTSMVTTVETLGRAPQGGYLSTLPPDQLRGVASTLDAAGVDARVQPFGWWTLLRYMVGYTPAVMAAAVAILAAFSAGIARSASQAQRVAFARTLGARAPFARDLGMSALLLIGSYAVLGSAAVVILRAYNGGSQLVSYFAVCVVMLSSLLAAFLGGSCFSALLPRRLQFRAAFSDWRPWSRGRSVASAVQVLTVALVVFLLTQALVSWAALNAVRESRPEWQSCATCTTTIFQGYDGPEALDAAVKPFASAARALESTGGTVLSWVPGAQSGDRYTPGDPESNVIVVNKEYITRSAGRLPDPLDGADGPGDWGLLVPSDQADRAPAIGAAWSASFRDPLGEVPDRASPKQPHLATYSPGPVFNYGRTGFRTDVYSISPVIVVVPASAGLLDDESYFAAGTAGDLLFTGDASATRQALDAGGVSASVYVVDKYSVQVARGVSDAEAKLPLALIGGLIGLLAVIGTLLIRAQAYALAHRDRILFHLVRGRSPARLHLRAWLHTAALLVASGVAIIIGLRSGLTGPDIVPGTLGVTYAAVGLVVLLIGAVVTIRASSVKKLTHHAK
ncbi:MULTISPECIES: hypothetical protein [unclassified Curtobacterium]|uniref:hypothetical protein n=1 Tax=unclassified Curtobacterium TaxID=257496 RepID=UPI00380E4BE8